MQFEALNNIHTRISVVLEWLPEGLVEKAAAAVSLDDHRVSPRRPNESHTTSVGSRNESDEPDD